AGQGSWGRRGGRGSAPGTMVYGRVGVWPAFGRAPCGAARLRVEPGVESRSSLSTRYAKRPLRGALRIWRRGGDSNPRGAINACLISSQVHSTTLPPLRWFAAGAAKGRHDKGRPGGGQGVAGCGGSTVHAAAGAAAADGWR